MRAVVFSFSGKQVRLLICFSILFRCRASICCRFLFLKYFRVLVFIADASSFSSACLHSVHLAKKWHPLSEVISCLFCPHAEHLMDRSLELTEFLSFLYFVFVFRQSNLGLGDLFDAWITRSSDLYSPTTYSGLYLQIVFAIFERVISFGTDMPSGDRSSFWRTYYIPFSNLLCGSFSRSSAIYTAISYGVQFRLLLPKPSNSINALQALTQVQMLSLSMSM